MPQLYSLSDEDIRLLKEALTIAKGERVNTPSRPGGESAFSDGEDHQSSESYIFKAPSGGISALSGTTPGKALCDIYRLIDNTLQKVNNIEQKWVYNVSTTAVGADEYFSGKKTKYGFYVVDCHCG